MYDNRLRCAFGLIVCVTFAPPPPPPHGEFNQVFMVSAMLRVWGISGEELASLTTGEVSVAALKLLLRELHGCPVCLQEVLHCSTRLEDGAMLNLYPGWELFFVSLFI